MYQQSDTKNEVGRSLNGNKSRGLPHARARRLLQPPSTPVPTPLLIRAEDRPPVASVLFRRGPF
jgi:hypothetical protein